MEKENVFIESLKIGEENHESGITYNELIAELQRRGFTINDSRKNAMYPWFKKAFDTATWGGTHEGGPDTKSFITGDAYFNLLDYEELKQAYKAAEDSTKTANKALNLTLIALLVSIFIGVVQIYLQVHSK
jgi:hypothetical protein